MKPAGIIISLLGAALFIGHFVMAGFFPEQFGYFSHQVRAVDGLIVLLFGVVIYFLGSWRAKRKTEDAVRVRFLKAAGNLGFSLAEIAEILKEPRHGNSPCPMVRDIIVRRIAENEQKIKEMQKLQRRMRNSLQDWSSGPPEA